MVPYDFFMDNKITSMHTGNALNMQKQSEEILVHTSAVMKYEAWNNVLFQIVQFSFCKNTESVSLLFLSLRNVFLLPACVSVVIVYKIGMRQN